ncbi:MAG: GDSL-type esterase/lipase family protein [Patescibacteria group bacterium]|mgnify:CR=1 FL=1
MLSRNLYIVLAIVFLIFVAVVINRFAPQGSASSYLATQIAQYDIPSISNPNTIFVKWNYAYVGTNKNLGAGSEFYIFNISNPQQISPVGQFNIEDDINSIYVDNNIAYLATSANDKELILLDVKNKSAPQMLGNYDVPTGNNALSVYAVGNTIFVGTQNNLNGAEFYTLNASSTSTIIPLGSFDVTANVNDIDVSGDYAYLATSNGTREFLVLNILNPQSITQKTSVNIIGSTIANGVAYHDGKLFGVTNDNGSNPDFFIWQISSTTPLKLLKSFDFGTNNSDVLIYENQAYVSSKNSTGNIIAVDISDPSAPVTNIIFAANAPVNGIGIKNSNLYLVNDNNSEEVREIFPSLDSEPKLADINGDNHVTITCLGDSNTAQLPPPSTFKSWCTILGNSIASSTQGVWRTTNQAIVAQSLVQYGMTQLNSALENDSPDAIIIALGSWDIALLGISADYTFENIMNTYRQLESTARSYGIDTFFAFPTLVLDTYAPLYNHNVLDLHNRLRHEFPAAHIIDFPSPLVRPNDYFDNVHLNQFGHNKVAREALREVFPNSASSTKLK